MKKIIFALSFFILTPLVSHAELHPRDIDGDLTNGHEAVYDDVLDITWLADANLQLSESFGVYDGSHDPFGLMSWNTTQNYILAMNAYNNGAGYFGVTIWRLPSVSPVGGGSEFNTIRTFDGSSDIGYQISAPVDANNPYGQSAGFTGSELAYHYYNNLGAIGSCKGIGINITNNCDVGPVSGIDSATNTENLALFRNIGKRFYWTGTDLGAGSTQALVFTTLWGDQRPFWKDLFQLAWPVADGDVANKSDVDNDGHYDTSDNCVEIPNLDQADGDGDGLGDLCDRYPEDADNFAQCDGELGVAITEIVILEDQTEELNGELANCNAALTTAEEEINNKDRQIESLQNDNDTLRSLIDSDADGVPDEIDECSGTPPWKWKVNSNGCHQSQMSGSIKQEHMKYPFISIQ